MPPVLRQRRDVSRSANSLPVVKGGEARGGNGDGITEPSLPRSWAVSDALRLTSSCPHGMGHRRGCHHYRAPVQNKGHPIVAQLRSRDRSCPQVLQNCIQLSAASVWTGEDPILLLVS